MVKMSPETREKAMLRVPEQWRELVQAHIDDEDWRK
jgi:hypothetical protein